MKLVRLLWLGAAAFALLIVAVGMIALNSRVQTWAARRALSTRPELHATLGSLSAGLGQVVLKDVRVESRGAVLTLPSLEADLPLISAGVSHRILVTRLVAKGWTLDLSKASALTPVLNASSGPKVGRTEATFSLLTSGQAADAPAVAAQVFQGVFSQLQLPVDLTLDGLALDGEIILPGARGHARMTLTGGGLAVGHEGRFDLKATTALTNTAVSTLDAHVVVAAAMDTPRTFTRLGLNADATASGASFPRGVKLTADVAAARTANGENYTLTLITEKKQLAALQASLPPSAKKLDGTWKIDASDADLAPFTLGRALPTFTADGAGRFELDPASFEIHLSGKLDATAENLAPVVPQLAALGRLNLATEFDLTQSGEVTRVEQLSATVTGAKPIAKVETLQTLEFNRKTRGMKVIDPARDLLALGLQGVPLAWVQPWLPDMAVTGGDLHGEFFAMASEGGFSLRSKSPLVAAGVSVAQSGRPLLRGLDLTLNASFDFTPQGWQASVAPFTVRVGNAPLLTLEAKAGQLAGADQPIKSVGKFSANLAALLAQPTAAGTLQLVRGDAAGEFAAQLGKTQEIQAKLTLTNLVADPKLTTEKLPAITADLRADVAADGQVSLNVPLLVERDGRKSDLALVGTVIPGKPGFTIAARVTSTHLVVEDVKILAAPLATVGSEPTTAAPAAGSATVKPVTAPWAGINGQLALTLKEVIWSDSFRVNDVSGVLRLDASAIKLEQLRAGLGGGGEAKAAGAVTFDAKSKTPFSLTSDVTVSEFDPAPLFRALDSSRPATVEGKFNVASKLAGRAASLGDLATTAHGDFQLTSKGGVFRGLPINAAAKVETASKLAAGAAFLGNLAGAVTGRKEYADIGSRAQALSEVAKIWQAVAYDQLSVVISRDESLNTVLKDFTLISPELRLTGGGRATHVAGRPLLEEALAMEFKLRARGHHGDVLKYLGVLEATTDELGYAACTLPVKVGGTIGSPDTSELNRALANLALEKSGATDLLNKLLGGR